MLDHIILTVSDVQRSLKFYTAALTPLKITMFLPYKGADGHPDLWGFGDWSTDKTHPDLDMMQAKHIQERFVLLRT